MGTARCCMAEGAKMRSATVAAKLSSMRRLLDFAFS